MITHREVTSARAAPVQRARMPLWQTWLALVGILLIAAQFRTLSLYSWDGSSNLHPDERFIVYTVYVLQVPHSIADYFRSGCAVNGQVADPSRKVDLAGRPLPPDQYEPSLTSGCNTLNPRNYGWAHFFAYGTLPTSLTRLVAELRNNWQNPGSQEMISPIAIRDAGRSLSAFFDLWSVLVVFLIGRRLYGERTGLLAAGFYGLAVLPIQLAHFFTVDAATGFFLLFSVYWSVRASQRGGIGTFIMLGLSIGAAMACRITMATLGLLAMIAVAQRVWGHRLERRTDAEYVSNRITFIRGALLLIVAGLMTFLSARILGPDLFIGTSFFDIRPEPRFIESITSVSGYVSGKIDAPFSQQWADRTPFLFPIGNMIIWGLGIPLGIAAWLAWAVALWQIVRRRILKHLLPVFWIGFYFAWQGGQFGMTMRYYVSLYGLFALLAAWGLVALWDWQRNTAAQQQNDTAQAHSGILQRMASISRMLAPLPTILVVVGTFLWAIAFSAIYTRPHSRIEASNWIYANIPDGSTITSEVWDDALPLAVNGHDPYIYTIIQTSPYQEDDEIKYTGYIAADGKQVPGLFEQLDQADYIILSSNRVYGSATRLPMRYPAITRYYHYLFNGELGFQQVADIHSYPTLFGLQIPDQSAEEAFSVYDHPRVLIFKKTSAYTRQHAEQLITDGIAWGEIYKLPTVKIRQVPTALRLTDTQWPAYRVAGTWVQLFNPQNITSRAPWLFWLLILELLGLAAFALLFRPLARLPDRGYALAKTLGLLLVAYGAWLLGSFHLAAFTPTTVWLCALPFLVFGIVAAWVQRQELAAFARQRRLALLTAEGLFLLAFFGFLLIRTLNPDLWHPARGGEKPMDLAFLTAVLKSAAFPPYDPWFAGGYINYYYFGFVLVGTLIHLTGIVPEIGYNLAIPTLFGLTALGAWGVAYNLVAPKTLPPLPNLSPTDEEERTGVFTEQSPLAPAWARGLGGAGKRSTTRRRLERRASITGVLAALFVAVAGNLAQAYWLLPGTANPAQPMLANIPRLFLSYATQQSTLNRPEWAYWDATRTVGYALGDQLINEFPFFTFLYGDLHAHMIALPIGIAVLGLLVSLVRSPGSRLHTVPQMPGFRRVWAALRPDLGPLVLLALMTGTLRATNTWDYPGSIGISLLTFVLIGWSQVRRSDDWPIELIGLAVRAGLLLGLGTLLFQPFLKSFATDYAGFSIWFGTRTPTAEYLKINGVWLFALISGGTLLYRRSGRMGRIPLLAIVLAASGLIILTAVLGMSALLAIGLLLCGALVLLFDLAMRQHFYEDTAPLEVGPISLLLALWGLCALGLTLIPEVLVAKGDIGRMNTVFKLGLQSWTLLAILSAVALSWTWQHFIRGVWTWIWRGAAVLLGTAMLVYPIMATPARVADRINPAIGTTLDGMAYMPSGSWAENKQRFSFAEDAAAITWMRANIQGTPIILEGQSDQYGWAGRISTYTGLPTLLGWTWHVTQQRSVASVEPVLQNRQLAIQQIYAGNAPTETLQLLQNYGIEYVYVGLLERARYGSDMPALMALARNGTLKTIYQQGQTRIYQVPTNGQPPGVLTTSLPTIPANGPSPTDASLSDARVGSLPESDPYPQLGRGGMGEQFLAIGLWLGAWVVIQLLGMPLAAIIFGQLGTNKQHGKQGRPGWTDGGYTWARIIGLIMLGYATWLPVSAGFWRYDRAGLLAGFGLLIGMNLLVLVQMRGGVQVLFRHFWQYRRQILQTEALALIAFLVLLGLRAYNPDLWHPYWGGEKPFEFGLLNAVLRSPSMPPYSPFFSDGTVNYYYYGFFLVSMAVKATGIAPSVAFNLIVPTLFGLFVSGVFALAARISGQARIGLAAVGLVALLGNLASAFQVGWSSGLGPVLRALAGGIGGFGQRLDSWFVGPSRVIPNTINEFPLWGFLFADLHPHLIALPLTLLMIGLAYRLFDVQHRTESRSYPQIAQISQYGSYGLAALTLGALAITNSWDVPTYTLLFGGALAARAWRSHRSIARRLAGVLGGLLLAGLMAGLGALLYSPFFQNFKAPVGGIGLVTTPTLLRDYLLVYGLPLALVVPALLGAAWRLLAVRRSISTAASPVALRLVARPFGPELMPRALVLLLAVVVAAAVAAAIAGPLLLTLGSVLRFEPPAWLTSPPALLGTRVWLAALLLIAMIVLLDRRIGARTWFGAWVASVGLAVSFGFELIYIRDHLAGGDWYRMNTVFKFGLQAWVLLGLAAALALPTIARALRRAGLLAEALAWPSILMLVLMALVFPFAGVASRTAYRFATSPVPTLDGLAFLDSASYTIFPAYLGLPDGSFAPTPIELRYDADAIRWLNGHITGTPVVLQSSAEFYRLYGVRIAANTGLPTVVSPLHEAEQRDPTQVYARDSDVQRFYRSADQNEIVNILARYHIGYVYIGPVERLIYGETGAATLAAMARSPAPLLRVAYRNQQVVIYQVQPSAYQIAHAIEPATAPVQVGDEQGLRALEQRVAAEPGNLDLAWQLALRYAERGRYSDAANAIKPQAQQRPMDVGVQQFYGDMLNRAGQIDAAEAAYRQAVLAEPSAANYTKLGSELVVWGRLDAAEEALAQAISSDPTLADPQFYLGQIAEERGQNERAVLYYRRCIELSSPTDALYEDAEAALRRLGIP